MMDAGSGLGESGFRFLLRMIEALICEECGGIISGEVPAGYSRCRCTGARTGNVPPPPSALEDVVPEQVEFAPKKICRVCGIDLEGKKRMKGPDGYICIPCAKAEDKLTIPCAECGRRLKPAGIIKHGSVKICRRCYLEHKEAEKIKLAPIQLKGHDKHNIKQIKILVAIAAVLLILIILSTIGLIGRH